MGGLNHLYSYARNNPLLIIDPLGLKCTRVSNWEAVTTISSISPDGILISSHTISNWKLVKEFDVLPFSYKGESSSLNCGCYWEFQGCSTKKVYSVPVLHKAEFECTDEECRVWKEKRYKEIGVEKIVETSDSCISAPSKITYGIPTMGGCSCKDNPPK